MVSSSPAVSSGASRPQMVPLDEFLSGPPPPPRPPLPWTRIVLTTLALILSLAVLGYVSVRGEQSARVIWHQVGQNLDRRDKPTDTPGGRYFSQTGAPSFDTVTADLLAT